MRTPEQMYYTILQFARDRADIRAVYLNGSRANPNAPQDDFMDYDVVYVTDKIAAYRGDTSWIADFGQIAVMQQPDDPAIFPDGHDPDHRYAFLMQFRDGVRIDLTLLAPSLVKSHYTADKIVRPLLDKDGILPPSAPATDRDYWVKPPTAAGYHGCCNEFWWVSTYVAKGLWRGELLYAIDQLNLGVRPMLLRMLCWWVGQRTGFKASMGKCCKYLPANLPSAWQKLLAGTYPPLDEEAIWQALFNAAELFSQAAAAVAAAQGFSYDNCQQQGALDYLHGVQNGAFGTRRQ